MLITSVTLIYIYTWPGKVKQTFSYFLDIAKLDTSSLSCIDLHMYMAGKGKAPLEYFLREFYNNNCKQFQECLK